jgi:acetylornithine/succinyldiaminopimelate/putrescine aminotransferase/predicted amino acid dehydrogenase
MGNLPARRYAMSPGPPNPDVAQARADFEEFLRPRLAQLLAAFRLDVVFHRAQGDYLYCFDDDGGEVEVLDALGGFGASLFGHNHPELVALAREALNSGLPFNAQASVRRHAATLGRVLSQRIERGTGRSYVVTLASTGAEAVEAAIKHAELEAQHARERLLERSRDTVRQLRIRLREGAACLPADFVEQSCKTLGDRRCSSVDEVLAVVDARVRHVADAESRFLAIEGAFHGKSTGSLQLTHRDEYRRPWRNLGVRAAFIGRNNVKDLYREIRSARLAYPTIEYAADGAAFIRRDNFGTVAACFCEPIQGEGGIHELDVGFVRAIRRCADENGFPLVFDEIQCGMGRTGVFLSSERFEVRGDYYLLGKSLGGGLAKISALLVDRERYRTDFGYLHTSTFADDEYSSAIALGAMGLLDRDGGALMAQCARKGERLLRRLRDLQRRFPEQVLDVRGFGLMIGLELAPQPDSPSPLLRVLSEQDGLAYLACGYLLNEHRVRMGPTLAEKQVLRIEPSAYVSDEWGDRVCAGLEQFLTELRAANVASLLGFVVRRPRIDAGAPREAPRRGPAAVISTPPTSPARRAAFLVHFPTAADLKSWETGLDSFSEAECEEFLDRTCGLLRPFVSHRGTVTSSRGQTVELIVIGVPFTAAQAIDSMRRGNDWCLQLVKDGVRLARELGCGVVGLGGHTSIVCDNGRGILDDDDVALTSGNSLTVAAAYDDLLRAARRVGLCLHECCMGVVGASGNVGAAIAELAADDVGRLLLIGRPGAERFLRPVAERICAAACDRVLAGQDQAGIPRAISGCEVVRRAVTDGSALNGNLYDAISNEMGRDAPVQIRVTMQALRGCDLVVSATNAPRPVVTAAHLADGPVVVCDVAVPRDVDPDLMQQRPNVILVKGGMIRAPLGQSVDIPGMRLRDGELYGCLAETILLGFVEQRLHYSYGRLSTARVREVREWAATYGFQPAET